MGADKRYDFLMTFPCFVVELEGGGTVSIPLAGAQALAVLTDDQLAERFAVVVSTTRNEGTTVVSLPNRAELRSCLELASQSGATLLAIDPDGFHGEKRQFRCHEATIERALSTLDKLMQR